MKDNSTVGSSFQVKDNSTVGSFYQVRDNSTDSITKSCKSTLGSFIQVRNDVNANLLRSCLSAVDEALKSLAQSFIHAFTQSLERNHLFSLPGNESQIFLC